jgi:hypothetical protein
MVLKVRLEGIDCPERGEPYSTQARNKTRVMLFDKSATFRGTDVDRYGRLVARITVAGLDTSIQLVRDGLACHFTRYSSDSALATAQRDAQRLGFGFWAAGAPKPACAIETLRAATPLAAGVTFHGNTSSHVFHHPSCKNYNCRRCTVLFASLNEAEAAGYKPAGDCLR